MFLRQSTSQIIRFGPFVDSTDGVTPETALTIAQADMQLSKDGATFAQKNATGNAAHDTDGWYSTTLNTTDTATTGELKLQINVAGALPVWETWFVLTQTAYDALQTGTFNNLGGTPQTADNDTKLSTLLTRIVGTLATGTHNPATAAQIAVLSDWINGGRLDLILDIIAADVVNIDGAAMRGTDSANTVVPPSVSQFNARTIPSASYALASVATEARLAELDAANLPTGIAAIPTNPLLASSAPTNFSDLAISVTTGQVTVGNNNDKTGYSLSQTFPTNFADLSISLTTGLIDITQTAANKSWSSPTRVLTAGTNLNDLSAAQVNSECDTAISDASLATSAEISTLTGVVDDLAIKKNTILNNFEFLMVLTSDHATPATGLTVTGERSIDGGVFVAVGGAISEVSNGIYQFDALASDTNGLLITWRFSEGTADDTFVTFKTVQ